MIGSEDSPFQAMRQLRESQAHGGAPLTRDTTETTTRGATETTTSNTTNNHHGSERPLAPTIQTDTSEQPANGEEVIVGRALAQNVYIDSAMEDAILAISNTTVKGTRNRKPSRSLAAYFLMSIGLAEWERQGRPAIPREMARRRRS